MASNMGLIFPVYKPEVKANDSSCEDILEVIFMKISASLQRISKVMEDELLVVLAVLIFMNIL